MTQPKKQTKTATDPAPWVATVLPIRRRPSGQAFANTKYLEPGEVPSICSPAIMACQNGAKHWG